MKILNKFILMTIALFLATIIFPLGTIFKLVNWIIFKRNFTGKWFLTIAVAIDQLGNVICDDLFNYLLIDKNSKFKFGNKDETISSVLGKNKKAKCLTKYGKIIVFLLHQIDKNHSIKSIGK